MQALPTRHSYCAACAVPLDGAAVHWEREVFCSLECARKASPGARVLLIARNAETARPYREALAAAGHRVLAGVDALAALRAALREGVDLVLVEEEAEPIGGLAVAAVLAAEMSTAALPVVILAEREDQVLRQRARDVGAAGVLVKPLPSTLLGVVRRWAGRRRGEQVLHGP